MSIVLSLTDEESYVVEIALQARKKQLGWKRNRGNVSRFDQGWEIERVLAKMEAQWEKKARAA